MSMPEIACPDCGHHFNPLPPKPETPPEMTGQEPMLSTPAARTMVVDGLLKRLADSLRRSFGFVTDVKVDQRTRTWTLSVSVPEQRAITDDVTVVDAEVVEPS